MPIKHSKINDRVIVTFINRPVTLDDVFAEIESLARFAHEKAEWHQIVVMGESTISYLPYIDVITLSEWLRGVCDMFSHCWLAFCARADADFKVSTDLSKLLASDRISVAVFRELKEAREWKLFASDFRNGRGQHDLFAPKQ